MLDTPKILPRLFVRNYVAVMCALDLPLSLLGDTLTLPVTLLVGPHERPAVPADDRLPNDQTTSELRTTTQPRR